jgi:hypothetical protein
LALGKRRYRAAEGHGRSPYNNKGDSMLTKQDWGEFAFVVLVAVLAWVSGFSMAMVAQASAKEKAEARSMRAMIEEIAENTTREMK